MGEEEDRFTELTLRAQEGFWAVSKRRKSSRAKWVVLNFLRNYTKESSKVVQNHDGAEAFLSEQRDQR